MRDPIVIDPPGFDQAAAWKECGEFVENCGGVVRPDGEVNWQAAFGADPGCCSCPKCGEMYWAWGRTQRCSVCSFEYPTDWWPMYSWGTHATKQRQPYRLDERMQHPYYRLGFENPVADPWAECHTQAWRERLPAALSALGVETKGEERDA